MYKRTVFLVILVIAGCIPFNKAAAQQLNTLSLKEKNEGWQLLFDGKDLDGWHSYLGKKPAKAWHVQHGTILLDRNNENTYSDYADLTTDGEYDNFDLKIEWKMEPCANSGILFYVHEAPSYKETWYTGPEMQIADQNCGRDSRILKHRAGALYDLAPVDTEWVKPGGQWNSYEIISDGGHLRLLQNGHKVIDIYMWDDHWRELISQTKFSAFPDFGTFHKGHIAIQGTEYGRLWFRNIKIKKL